MGIRFSTTPRDCANALERFVAEEFNINPDSVEPVLSSIDGPWPLLYERRTDREAFSGVDPKLCERVPRDRMDEVVYLLKAIEVLRNI